MKQGILILDKPMGFTSHDVVSKMRGILKLKRVGHGGTLDPMATGVLPIFFGAATKSVDRLPDQKKGYEAVIRLGLITDTQDITGKVLEKWPVSVTVEEIKKVLSQFTGEILQVPPMYSAVKIEGQRLYKLARAGKVVERPPRPITIYENKLINYNPESLEITFQVICSKGSYIRTLGEDIGRALGCGATLTQLRRTYSSGFTEENALTLEQVEALNKQGLLYEKVLPVDKVFEDYTKVILSKELSNHYLNGVPLWLTQLELQETEVWLRLYGPDNHFLGIGYGDSLKNQLTLQTRFSGEVSY